jgi:dynein heavy chain
LLSFLLCYRLQEFLGKCNAEHFRFLLTGGVSLNSNMPEIPKCEWITNKMWDEINKLSNVVGFDNFYVTVGELIDEL